MNRGPLLFLGLFFVLAASWFGLVLIPQIEVGRQQETTTVGDGVPYPVARPGLAKQGAEVYRASGCVQCHSQQVRQSGVRFDVLLTELGTNMAALSAAKDKVFDLPGQDMTAVKIENRIIGDTFSPDSHEKKLRFPEIVLSGVTSKTLADEAQRILKAAGADAEVRIVPLGPDIARGYGPRRTVAADYLFDYPVQLGSQRIGPDLANIGLRSRGEAWQLQHLYAPRSVVEGSTMPPYRFLFEKRPITAKPSPEALKLTGTFAPPEGWEIVPKPEAVALVAYLNSLKSDAPLFDAPAPIAVASAAVATNNPVAK